MISNFYFYSNTIAVLGLERVGSCCRIIWRKRVFPGIASGIEQFGRSDFKGNHKPYNKGQEKDNWDNN